MHNYLVTFDALLRSLNGCNMVLAGTAALQAHGLKMSRIPSDLDVVIFTPTPIQLTILRALNILALKIPNQHEYPFDMTKQFKFMIDGYIVNILIEDKPTPVDLLFYSYQDTWYRVQDIAYIMDSKLSYKTKDGKHRLKDIEDCLDLKQSNFNIR
jgi:hypothetical protein